MPLDLTPTIAISYTGYLEELKKLWQQLSDDDHVAWVVARPPSTGDDLAPLTRDICTALGVVGLRQPRAVGERHLGRVVPHLLHGPVTDLIITEAQWLPEEVITEVEQACLGTGVRLWLLVHAPVPTGLFEALLEKTGQMDDLPATLEYWAERRRKAHAQASRCDGVRRNWWPEPHEHWAATPARNSCDVHDRRIDCLLTSARRELRAARLGPDAVREQVLQLAASAAFDVDELWALRAMSLDLYTPALDALNQTLPPNIRLAEVKVGDVSADGSVLRHRAGISEVPPKMRSSLARQRTSNLWCNGNANNPLLAMFDGVLAPKVRRI